MRSGLVVSWRRLRERTPGDMLPAISCPTCHRSSIMSRVTTARTLTALLFVMPVAFSLAAQKPKRSPSPPRPRPDSTRGPAAPPSDPALRALHWRLVGPFRGGRVAAVAGDPVHPLIFYFGAVDGGVWKTTNGGETWRNVSDGTSDIASVGAIAVA